MANTNEDIASMGLTFAKGCDKDVHGNGFTWKPEEADPGQITVIARQTIAQLNPTANADTLKVNDTVVEADDETYAQVDDETPLCQGEQVKVRPALYVGGDLVGDAYMSEEDADSTTTVVGGLTDTYTRDALLKKFDGSVSKILDAILFADADSQFTALDVKSSGAFKVINLTNSAAWTLKPSTALNISTVSGTGNCTYASTTSDGTPVTISGDDFGTLSDLQWVVSSNTNAGITTTTTISAASVATTSTAATGTYADATGKNTSVTLTAYAKFTGADFYKRNKKGSVSISTTGAARATSNSSTSIGTTLTKVGSVTASIFVSEKYVAIPSNIAGQEQPDVTAMSNAQKLALASSYLKGSTAEFQVGDVKGAENPNTDAKEAELYTVNLHTDSYETGISYYRVFALPACATLINVMDSSTSYTASFDKITTGEGVDGKEIGAIEGIKYHVYFKTSADSNAKVKMAAAYSLPK